MDKKVVNAVEIFAQALEKAMTTPKVEQFIPAQYFERRAKVVEDIIQEHWESTEFYKEYMLGQDKLEVPKEIVQDTAEKIISIIKEMITKSAANVDTAALAMITGIVRDLLNYIAEAILESVMDSRREKYDIVDYDPSHPEVMKMADVRNRYEMFIKARRNKIYLRFDEAILKAWKVIEGKKKKSRLSF